MTQGKKYWLVTDAPAVEVEAKTGLPAHQTRLGALVEQPPAFDLEKVLDELDRAMHPRCTCGKFAIMHSPRCPFAYMVS